MNNILRNPIDKSIVLAQDCNPIDKSIVLAQDCNPIDKSIVLAQDCNFECINYLIIGKQCHTSLEKSGFQLSY
jgi:ribosomal protein L7Ae-like RNA K-turn-binding protein